MGKIYLDNAATTAMYGECVSCFEKYGEFFYNPSALYAEAAEVKAAINGARASIASLLGADRDEIVFTASGTESDNLALLGAPIDKKSRILINSAEHSAVYSCAEQLKSRGWAVEYIPVDCYGKTDEKAFFDALGADVGFVSVMHVNNETGALNDIKKLRVECGRLAPRALFHCDGVQAFGKIKVNVADLGVDLYSISAHKIKGPKGVGALYKKRRVALKPIIFGGGQESGLRSATENAAGIAAFAKAAELCETDRKTVRDKNEGLKTLLIDRLSAYEDIKINTDAKNSAPHIVNFAMKRVRGEVMLHALEKRGILVGTGSACSSNKGGKRIPAILGLCGGFEEGVLRLSFGRETTAGDLETFLSAFDAEYEELKKYVRV